MIVGNLRLIQLVALPVDDLQPLLVESRQQGFEFLQRLVNEYARGTNCFAGSNEALFSVYNGEDLIAVGGLNADPYLKEEGIGRVRHVYVLSAWRRQGVGRLLVERIIEEASHNYSLLTLRTFNPQADQFYRAIGFQTKPEIKATTHYLVLNESIFHDHKDSS